jgi:FlaA1/EpsC-like NDP-sugar epimerase
MERHHKTEMIRVLSEKIKTQSFNNRAVFLFGHCNATEEMANYLLSHDAKATAILDNSISKQGLSYREIPILSPEQIRKYNADNSIVLIATRFFAQMSEQLRRLDYDGEIVQVVEYNSFVEYSLSDETLKRKTARMQRGVAILERIRTQHPSEHLIICPNNTIGDVYLAMSFLTA